MRGPDFGRFVRHGILIGGAIIAHSDVHSQVSLDLTGQFPQGHILQHGDIFSDEGHHVVPLVRHGVVQREGRHQFEKRESVHSPRFHHPAIHGFIPPNFDSGFLGTNGTTPEIIGSNHLPSRDGYDFSPPTTNEVREGGKVISKFISQSARAREGEAVDPDLVRQLNTLEYQFRRITTLPPADQQLVVTSFFEIIGEFEPPSLPPDNWLADATPEQREKIGLALELLAAGGISAGIAMAIARREYKRNGFKKTSSLLVALATLVVASCGGNAAETATAFLPGGQPVATEQTPIPPNPNVSVATETPIPNSIPPGDPVTSLGGGSGGQEISCDATAGTLVDRFRTPAGSRIPKGIMALHSANTSLWTPDEISSLKDGNGNTIAPVVDEIIRSIAGIDPEALVTNVVSGEGYVLVVTKKGRYVWAIDANGSAQSRPDVITGTKGFRYIPDPPPGVDGDKRYAVSGGCGVLGVYDKDGNMIAVYKPIADKWELVNPPSSASATPMVTLPSVMTPEPTTTPELSAGEQALRDATSAVQNIESNVAGVHFASQDVTNAGAMSLDIEQTTAGGPLKELTISEGAFSDLDMYAFAKLAIAQAKFGDHPQDFPEMAGFPFTNYDEKYIQEGLSRVAIRYADGNPYTAGIFAYEQTNYYNYFFENGGLDPTTEIFGFKFIHTSAEEFEGFKQELTVNHVPNVRVHIRPGANPEGHTEADYGVIAFVAQRADGKPIITLVGHNEHMGNFQGSLEQAMNNMVASGKSETVITRGTLSTILEDAIGPFKVVSGGNTDIYVLMRNDS